MQERQSETVLSKKQTEVLSRRLREITERFDIVDKHAIVFLDASARPLARFFTQEWKKNRPKEKTPLINYVNFGMEKATILIKAIVQNTNPELFTDIPENIKKVFKHFTELREILDGNHPDDYKQLAARDYIVLRRIIPDCIQEIVDTLTLEEFKAIYGEENIQIIQNITPRQIELTHNSQKNDKNDESSQESVITIIDDFEITGTTKRLMLALFRACHPDTDIEFVGVVENEADKEAFVLHEGDAPHMPWSSHNFRDKTDRPLFHADKKHIDDRSFLMTKTQNNEKRERALNLYREISGTKKTQTLQISEKIKKLRSRLNERIRRMFR